MDGCSRILCCAATTVATRCGYGGSSLNSLSFTFWRAEAAPTRWRELPATCSTGEDEDLYCITTTRRERERGRLTQAEETLNRLSFSFKSAGLIEKKK